LIAGGLLIETKRRIGSLASESWPMSRRSRRPDPHIAIFGVGMNFRNSDLDAH